MSIHVYENYLQYRPMHVRLHEAGQTGLVKYTSTMCLTSSRDQPFWIVEGRRKLWLLQLHSLYISVQTNQQRGRTFDGTSNTWVNTQ